MSTDECTIGTRNIAIDGVMYNVPNPAADKIEAQQAALSVCSQFLLEVSHAMASGPNWYTKGEQGLRQQIYMWIERTHKALAGVAKQ